MNVDITERTDEETPRLSVIIPTHNVRAWVAETLRSVLTQDVGGMEVIVVDDHSEDGTDAIVERMAARDARVRLVRASSRGGGSARNEGVRRARGRYLVFADGDDIVPEGAYHALVSSLEASGSQIAIGDYLKFSPSRTWQPTASMAAFRQPVQGVTLAEIPTMIFSRPCWNKAFDRDFWNANQIVFPDVPRSNDIVPMVTAYVKATRIDVIDDVVYLYRDRPGATSMTSKASSSASFLSYVTQEKICAELVASVGSAELDSRYSSLIHDRDGFFHVRKFLASWVAPQDDDHEAVRLLSELLAVSGKPADWINVRKRLTMRLFAAGELMAARAVAQTVDGGWGPDDDLVRLRAMTALFEVSAEIAADLDERELLDSAARTLENVSITDSELETAWVALARAAERRFGDEIRSRVPEFAGGDVARGAARQREFAGTVTPLFGGDPLRVHARGASSEATPVLWSASTVIRPSRFSWSTNADGATCNADFSISQLPHRLLLQPAFAFDDGVVVSAFADSEVPTYRRFENVLYEQHGAWVRLERRSHWVIRAPRRLLMMARDVLRRTARR